MSESFANRCAQCWQDGFAYPWAIVAKNSGEFIGVVELRVRPPEANFGYILAERYWGQGLATEAIRPVVDWAYAQAELTRLWATCHPDNTRSARVLGKLGLVLEASRESLEPRPQLGELAGPSLVFARVKPAHAGPSAGTRGND